MKFSLLLLKGKINLNTHRWFRRVWQKCYSWPQFSSEKCTVNPPLIITDEAIDHAMTRNIGQLANSDSKKEKSTRGIIPYEQFDLFVEDLKEKDLFNLPDSEIGTRHLSEGSFSQLPQPPRGKIHGPNRRFVIPLPCRRVPNGQIINIWFLVDTGAPYTSVSLRTITALFGNAIEPTGKFPLHILDPKEKLDCEISRGHFYDINLLGTDTLEALQLTPVVEWHNKTFVLAKIKLSLFGRYFIVG